MFMNDAEYKAAVQDAKNQETRLAEQVKTLEGMGLSPAQIKRATNPVRSFHMGLLEELAEYERLRREQ